MKSLKRAWLWLVDAIGYAVPAEIDESLPKTLDEYRRRKEFNEQQVRAAQARQPTGRESTT